MADSNNALSDVRQIFNDWERLLASKSESEFTTPLPGSDWSIKDVIGHLRAWQQVSIARMEAGDSGSQPAFPDWLGGLDPDEDDNPHDWNALIYTIYQSQTWAQVYRAWHDGFVHFLALGEAMPAEIRGDSEKFPWLKGYSLDDVLRWSGEHHQEHLDVLIGNS